MDKVLHGRVSGIAVTIAAIFMLTSTTTASKTLLPNGWSITPAGRLVKLGGDMPLRIVPAPDGHAMLVVTGGYHDHAIDVIDPKTGVLRQHLLVGKA
jgi:hypothetical protein